MLKNRYLWLLLGTVLAPVIMLRLAAFYSASVNLEVHLIRAIISDLTSVGLVLFVMQWVLGMGQKFDQIKLSKWIVGFLTLAWLLINYGNYEHILANDSNIDPTNFKYMKSTTFLKGSFANISHPLIAILCFLLPITSLILLFKESYQKIHFGFPLIVLSLIAQTWPVDKAQLLWQQEHPLHSLFRPGVSEEKLNQFLPVDAELQKSVQADLKGKPRFEFPKFEKKPNVLLIMIEGISGAHISALAQQHKVKLPFDMPKLSEFAKKNFAASSFIAHQRQTDRGEYSLLCGDYDKLLSRTPRMTEVATAKTNTSCLPDILQRNGYHTIYLQPAPMSFMMKDRFMEKVGFKESKGADFFVTGYKKGGWGVDDKAFFEQSLKVFEDLEKKNEPWFAALMTVGTHHPLIVPSSFAKRKNEDEFAHAIRYTDVALAELLDQMKKNGMLDHTLVIVTSDESRGIKEIGGLTRSISQNWGFLVASLPQKLQSPIMLNEPYTQSDVALSVIDYLGLENQDHGFLGRSLFRSYDQPRSIAFANIFFKSTYLLNEKLELTKCNEEILGCTHYQRKNQLFFGPGWDEVSVDQQDRYELQKYVNWSVRERGNTETFRPKTSMVTLDVGIVPLTQEINMGQWVFGGQFLTAPAGKKAIIELDMELDGEAGALVQIVSRLDIEHHNKYNTPRIGPTREGERYKLRYSYYDDQGFKQLEGITFVTRLTNKKSRLIVHKAEIRFEDVKAEEKELKGAVLEQQEIWEEVDRKWQKVEFNTSNDQVLDFFSNHRYWYDDQCISINEKNEYIGKNCFAAITALGPYANIPKDTILESTYHIKLISGKASFMTDISSHLGKNILAYSSYTEGKVGEIITITAKTTLKDDQINIENRLKIKNFAKAPFEFQLLGASLKISPVSVPK